LLRALARGMQHPGRCVTSAANAVPTLLRSCLASFGRSFACLVLGSATLYQGSCWSCPQVGFKGLQRICNVMPLGNGGRAPVHVEVVGTAHASAGVRRLVKSVVGGLRACQEPERAEEGLGGTYFFMNELGNRVAIMKPCDEEPLAPNNPKVKLRPHGPSTLEKNGLVSWNGACLSAAGAGRRTDCGPSCGLAFALLPAFATHTLGGGGTFSPGLLQQLGGHRGCCL
jgi:hypothetical protein